MVSSLTCSPARLTFKLVTREKYCKTASLDSGPALTKELNIWNSEFYTRSVSHRGTEHMCGPPTTNLQTFQSASQASGRTFNIRTALLIQVSKVSFRNSRPFMSKHIQPTQRAHQTYPFYVRRGGVLGVPFVQPRDHNRDGFY